MKYNLLFYLHPFVHVNIQNKVLLYNTNNGEHLTETSEKAKNLLNCLIGYPNKTLLLGREFVDDPEIAAFIDKVRSCNMGGLNYTTQTGAQAIQLMQGLKIQKGVEFLKDKDGRAIGEEILNYLTEATIYLNNTCQLNCKSCLYAYKQTVSCKKSPVKSELDTELVLNLLNFFNKTQLKTLHITGGNLFNYKSFPAVLKYLSNLGFKSIIHINAFNFLENWMGIVDISSPNITFSILVNNYSQLDIKSLIEILTRNFSNYSITFLIESEAEYEKFEELNKNGLIHKHELNAIYNGENLAFFEENIFIDIDMVFGIKHNLTHIAAPNTKFS